MSSVGLANVSSDRAIPNKTIRWLLACGVVSSILYAFAIVVTPLFYPGYSSLSQTVSELSAIDAPTRTLWLTFAFPYAACVATFGLGLIVASAKRMNLRIVGASFLFQGLLDFAWPPMHTREALAKGGATISDTMHLAFTAAWLVLAIVSLLFGANAFGRSFRNYTIATGTVLCLFGMLTARYAPQVQANLPTPYAGVSERINIAAYLAWTAALSSFLLA